MGYTIEHLEELEHPWPKRRLARRSLGLSSFGMNVAEIPPGEDIPTHDETESDQEEVFVCLEGTPTMVVDGDEHPLRPGTFARCDPEAVRTVRNDGPEPARVLIVSAPRTSGYRPPDWA